jgi:hypothetical protein
MSQWIKDTTILWIRNRGAGNTTTEYEVLQLHQQEKHKKEILELKKNYEN